METNSSEKDVVPAKKKEHPVLIGFAIVLGIIVVLSIIGAASGSGTSSDTSSSTAVNTPTTPCTGFNPASATTIDYKQFEKDPDSYKGTIAKFTGQIVQIIESNGVTNIRLAVSKTDYGWDPSSIVYIEYDSDTQAVDEDVVTVYGVIAGNYTYTSEANYQISVPSMLACTLKEGTVASVSAPIPKTPATTSVENQSAPLPVATPQPPAQPKTWHIVFNYTNSTTIQTPPFTLQGSEQRITYTCSIVDNTNPNVLFNGVMPSVDGSEYNTFANFASCPSQNTSYVYSQPPGQYYLNLTSDNAAYTVEIEDYY